MTDKPQRISNTPLVTLRDSRIVQPTVAEVVQSTSNGSIQSGRSQPPTGEFGSEMSAPSGSTSTTTKVRQRISREMIRETINQRIADGSLSKRSSVVLDKLPRSVDIKRASLPPPQAYNRTIPLDLAPPIVPPKDSIPMTKAHTTDAAPRKLSPVESRPTMRPRSQTQSAQQALMANEQNGVLHEPRSALDKLMAEVAPPGTNLSSSTASDKPLVGILLKPQERTPSRVVPPVHVETKVREPSPSPGSEGLKGRETATVAKPREREKDRQASTTSGFSGASGASKRGRRSLSTGDAGEEAESVRLPAHHKLALTAGRSRLSVVQPRIPA